MLPEEVEEWKKGTAAGHLNLRHLKWIKRHATKNSAKLKGWRPRKRHRMAASKWISMKDNMLRVGTGTSGLKHYQRDAKTQEWADSNAKSWPHAHLAQDQGSDGVCGIQAMLRKLVLCITEWWDESHGICNDVFDVMKKFSLFPFILTLMVLFKLPHGPEKEKDLRMAQLKQAEEMIYDVFTPEDCASFNIMLPDMLKELARMSQSAHGLDGKEAWELLREYDFFSRTGARVTLCRFMAWLRAARVLLSKWHCSHWVIQTLAIEMDFLQGAQFTEKIAMKGNLVQKALDQDTTSSAIPSVDGKALKSCCQNAVVVGLMLLDDPANRRLLSIMTLPCMPLDSLHSDQNKKCRSVDDNRSYAAEVVNGGLMKVCKEIIQVLGDPSAMDECDFIMGDNALGMLHAQEICAEDEWAAMLADICMQLVAHRIRRKMYCFGWPHLAIGLSNGDAIRGLKLLAKLKSDYNAWQWLKGKAGHPDVDALLRRSQFNNVAVQQLAQICIQEKWEFTRVLLQWILEHFAGCFGSQVVEDFFSVAKNAKQARGSKLFRRPERSMAIMVSKNVLTKRHHYEVEEAQTPLPSKSARLGPETFGKVPVQDSISLKGIASTDATPVWFSPGVKNLGLPVADLAVIDRLHRNESVWQQQIKGAPLACFVDCHHFVFQDMTALNKKWYYGITHWSGSGCVVWEVALEPVPGHPAFTYVDFLKKPQDQEPTVVSLTAWGMYEAYSFKWRSPAWNKQTFKKAGSEFKERVLAIIEDKKKPKPLKVVAAQNHWWSLALPDLKVIAAHLGIQLQPKSGLLDALITMTMDVLQCSEENALDIVKPRLKPSKHPDTSAVDELLEMDEAAKLFTKEDEEVLEKEQKKHREAKERTEDFARDYQEKRKTARDARGAASSSGRKGGKKAQQLQQQVMPSADELDHAKAQALLPPGAYIWRAFSSSSWQARLPPFATCSRSWAKAGGSGQALREVLIAVWKDYCLQEGIPPHECPMQGVWVTGG